MVRIPAFVVLAAGLVLPVAGLADSSRDKVLSPRDFSHIRNEVEILRGKKFLREMPVYKVSAKELRAISDREIDRQFPGVELAHYEELLAWLGMVPPGTSLKGAEGDLLVDQVAGLYDSVTKEMCIPYWASGVTNAAKKAADKKLEEFPLDMDNIVLAHEFTHALEDQYWPIDDPRDDDRTVSTDRGTAHGFVTEGLATRVMIEAIPSEMERASPGNYFLLWDLIHSGLGEFALNLGLKNAWKSDDALADGVPETLARSESIPYSFGYSFCAKIMREWGLDGLDYIYNHPPVSSEQVMHPKKCWEWRDFPVQIDLPDDLPGDWKQISLDIVGEADMAVFFGCQFTNLNRGLEIARGWDGDHVGLFEGPGGHRLLLWASSWDSTNAAIRFGGACLRERQLAHQASISQTEGNRVEWDRPDGRMGCLLRDGKHVILIETDDHEALRDISALADKITFTGPPEDAARAAANTPLRRFNPVWSWQKDGDYAVSRSLCGLLSRHDRNSVGAADSFVFGLMGESRRTTSFDKWQVGAGLVVRHESETRRGFTQTTLLPWGLLFGHSSARLPYAPDKTIARASLVWGLGGSVAVDGDGVHSLRVLPFGLLFRKTTGPRQSSLHILATGLSRKESADHAHTSSRFRVLGIPIWNSDARKKREKSAVQDASLGSPGSGAQPISAPSARVVTPAIHTL
jgi:hypothetical protein